MKKVALLRPFGRNLIVNPSGEDGFKGWKVEMNGGDGFKIERPPEGCANYIGMENVSVAFATSYHWCRKYQIIDLCKEGIEVSNVFWYNIS
ncbi:unnamed protein product [Gongylonema pulchrum]|uniref:FBA domain-containing protein n=1 Tax=Gongylonema pulchrum TaxID=637853 RepID=A0A183E808_9BILA|nr:unnamed protein product [Gongylonema pulchrum]